MKKGEHEWPLPPKSFQLKPVDSNILWAFATSSFAHEYDKMMALELLAWRSEFPGYSTDVCLEVEDNKVEIIRQSRPSK